MLEWYNAISPCQIDLGGEFCWRWGSIVLFSTGAFKRRWGSSAQQSRFLGMESRENGARKLARFEAPVRLEFQTASPLAEPFWFTGGLLSSGRAVGSNPRGLHVVWLFRAPSGCAIGSRRIRRPAVRMRSVSGRVGPTALKLSRSRVDGVK